ncbi:MAG: DUF3138 family protein [Rhodoferax sp.]|nr:DUF3138 family protein [Rhodoferax sp.]MCF8209752.1 DUF3138 family protein [Rhodoferax sp.]
MSFQRKLIVVALASVLPLATAHAQSAADLQKEIAALKAQLQALQQKVEALATAPASPAVSQQMTRMEQKQELADNAFEAAGLKGLKVSGAIEASYLYDSLGKAHTFAGGDGNGGTGMLELTKVTEEGEGVSWTLRLTPGAANLVHEATISAGLGGTTRILGGLIPDYQGYEAAFAHQNPLVTHNALFDLAGPASYTGVGLTYAMGPVALKWMVGNIDGVGETDPVTGASKPSTGLAYRADWTLSEFSYIGLSGAHANSTRSFDVIALDGGFTRGDWQLNAHLNLGRLKAGAYNGGDAQWSGLSGLVGYKVTPRLQLLARADYIANSNNGGGTYVANYLNNALGTPMTDSGLGPELDSAGVVLDPDKGASLTRLSLGTNYLLNASTQWKTELRLDQSSGYNFADDSGGFSKTKTTLGSALVVKF